MIQSSYLNKECPNKIKAKLMVSEDSSNSVVQYLTCNLYVMYEYSRIE